MSVDDAARQLRAAWTDMMAALGRARAAVDDPALHSPPATERGLAEGYRYLLGYALSGIERAFFEDADFPYFRRAIQPLDKGTIDNADALYLSAPIDGAKAYQIRGHVADHAHWRNASGSRSGTTTKAPQYLIVEAHTSYAGDSGKLAELAAGGRVITGALDSTQIDVGPDGNFLIVLGPEPPSGATGDYICTRSPGGDHARYVIVRALFHDWQHEVAPELSIRPLDRTSAFPAPPTPADIAERLRRVGAITEGQMTFWNDFYANLLGAFRRPDDDGPRFMPRNNLNAPNRAQMGTGGGQSTNVYSGGTFDLLPDEALIIEMTTPVAPAYFGFHLSNFWGESLDYANRLTSLNGFQSEPDHDGVTRLVVAHTDPGVPNWLDTTGLREGFLTARWTYPEQPADLPIISVRKVVNAQVPDQLPADTRTVTPEERREAIQIRQDHVQRRYRQY